MSTPHAASSVFLTERQGSVSGGDDGGGGAAAYARLLDSLAAFDAAAAAGLAAEGDGATAAPQATSLGKRDPASLAPGFRENLDNVPEESRKQKPVDADLGTSHAARFGAFSPTEGILSPAEDAEHGSGLLGLVPPPSLSEISTSGYMAGPRGDQLSPRGSDDSDGDLAPPVSAGAAAGGGRSSGSGGVAPAPAASRSAPPPLHSGGGNPEFASRGIWQDRYFEFDEFDTDKLALAIDHHTQTLKDKLMEEFMAAKKRMFLKHRSAIDGEMAETREILDALRAREAKLAYENAKFKIIVERISFERALRRDRLKHTVFLRTVFGTWRDNVRWNRRLIMQSERAGVFYRKRLLRKAFQAWQRHTQLGTRHKLNRKWQAKLQETSNTIVDQYEMEVGALRAQLGAAEDHISQAGDERVMFQQQMKRSFMRGVCALNLETMGVLRPSAEQVAADLAASGPEVGDVARDLRAASTYRSGYQPRAGRQATTTSGVAPPPQQVDPALLSGTVPDERQYRSQQAQEHGRSLPRTTGARSGGAGAPSTTAASRGSATIYRHAAPRQSSRTTGAAPPRVVNPTLRKAVGPRTTSSVPHQRVEHRF